VVAQRVISSLGNVYITC